MNASKSELVIGSSCGKLKPETMAALNKLAELNPEKVAIINVSFKEDEDGVCRFHLVAINRFGRTSKVKTLSTEALIVLLVERMIAAKKGGGELLNETERTFANPALVEIVPEKLSVEGVIDGETYAVIVGNIGTVCEGDNKGLAVDDYNEMVFRSVNRIGAASGEDVTFVVDGEPVTEHSPIPEDILYEEKLESLAQMTECFTYADIMSFKGDKSVALQLAILAEEAMEDSDPEMVEDVTTLPEFMALIDYIVGPVKSWDRFGGECYESGCPFHDKEEPLCNAGNVQMTRHKFNTEALCKSGELNDV